MNLGRQAIGTLLTATLRNAVALVTGIVVARTLGPKGRGEWAALLLPLGVAHMVAALGLPTATVILSSRGRFSRAVLWTNGLVHSAAVGALAAAAGIVLGASFPDLLAALEIRPALLPWLLPAVALLILQDHARALLQAERRILVANSLDLVYQFALFAAVCIGLALRPELPTLVLSFWIALAVYHVLAQPAVAPRETGVAADGGALLAGARLGVTAYLADLIQWLHYRADIFLLMAFRSAEDVGFYAVAVSLAESLWFVSRSLFFVLVPALGESEEPVQRRRVERASRLGIWLGILAAAVLAAAGALLIPVVYTEAFSPAVAPFLLLVPGAMALGAARVFSARHLAREAPELNARISAGGLALNLVLNLLWIPAWGPSGAALATSLSYGSMLAVYLVLYRLQTGAPWRATLGLERGDIEYLLGVVLARRPGGEGRGE